MPPAIDGYWGTPTSTIDWCEDNYVYSYYIAEMTNTISNLMMILPPFWGMIEVIRQGFERRFVYCHFLVLVVGLGSWAFHMTLLYEMQLFDELPMVWGTSVLVYCLSEVKKKPVKGQISNLPLLVLLISFAVIFTALYLLWPQPVFQHTYYGILVFSSFVLEVKLFRLKGCNICKKLFILSTSIYLFGFFLWNIDKFFCTDLRTLRASIPKGFDPLTQLHGWWHCLAGYGTYLQILFTFWYRCAQDKVLHRLVICGIPSAVAPSSGYSNALIHAANDFQYEKHKKNMELRPCFLGFSLRWFKKSRTL